MICKLMSKQSKTKELKKMDQEKEIIIEEMTRIEKEIIMKPQKRMPSFSISEKEDLQNSRTKRRKKLLKIMIRI